MAYHFVELKCGKTKALFSIVRFPTKRRIFHILLKLKRSTPFELIGQFGLKRYQKMREDLVLVFLKIILFE